MKSTLEESLEILSGLGLVLTLQRRAILKFLHEQQGHWTAEAIYGELRPRYGSLSRATVYKTLELLCEAGELQCLRLRKDVMHYDTFTGPHHHFLCEQCGAIIDIPMECPIKASGRIEGHRVDRCIAYFAGVCEACL
ncbi:MAG: transcriptional repressor [Deltaproteobacteria bacterium]|nr:transcriptional repressor [Deltaproteobacteria bacterium]